MNNLLAICTICLLLQSCSPVTSKTLGQKKYEKLPINTQVFIIDEGTLDIGSSLYVGTLKIGESGFTVNCDYTQVMEMLKYEAKQAGANIAILTRIKSPNASTTCYRITAKLYRNVEEDTLLTFKKKYDEVCESKLPLDANYAIVHFYRPRNYYGSAIGFKVRLDDNTVIGKMRNGERFTYKITEFCQHTFRGMTETTEEISFAVERGKEYYVRCGIGPGVIVGRPQIEIVDNFRGIIEIARM